MTRFALVLLLCPATLTWGGYVVPGGPWQQLPNPISTSGEKIVDTDRNVAGNQTAYWNQNTADGNTCRNIGCFVTGKSAEPNTPNWKDAAFLANNDGSSVTNVKFQGTVTTPNPTMLAEIAGLAASNWTGWYDSSLNPSALNAGNFNTSWGVIFKGVDGVNNTSAFTPTQQFGLWFLTGFSSNANETSAAIATALNGDKAKFSESAKNPNAAGKTTQYFSFFAKDLAATTASPFTVLVGVEDLKNGDFDYNDMIYSITLVPEPGFYGVLGLGLAGLAYSIRRRRATRV